MSDIGSILQIFVGAVLLGCLVYFSPKYVPLTTYNLAGIAAVALIFIGIIIHGFYSLERKHTEQSVSEPMEETQVHPPPPQYSQEQPIEQEQVSEQQYEQEQQSHEE